MVDLFIALSEPTINLKDTIYLSLHLNTMGYSVEFALLSGKLFYGVTCLEIIL